MMPNTIKYIFTLVYAAYFLLAGVGYNVVKYCSQTCAKEGIEVVAFNTFSKTHHHSHFTVFQNQKDDITCKDVKHSPTGCHLLRLNIDTPSFQAIQKLSVNTTNSIVLFYNSVNFFTETPELANQSIIHPPNSYFCPTGRDLITLHVVYLI